MSESQKTKRTVEKRGLNQLGKFFAKVRIELGLTTPQYATAVGASVSYINNVERGDKELTLDFVRNVANIIPATYAAEFAFLVASNLGVLVIPHSATAEQVQNAFVALVTPVTQDEE